MNGKFSVGCHATIRSRSGRDLKITSNAVSSEVTNWDITKPETSQWFVQYKGKKPEDELSEYVLFSKQDNTNVPEGIGAIFAAIKTFIFNDGGLAVLSKFDLRQFPEVERFDFESNKLEVLESGAFEFNKKLQSLSLKGNQIRVVSETFGLDKLRYIVRFNMLGNECINEDANFIESSDVAACRKFVEKVVENCEAPNGFDLDLIREEQWEHGRRIIQLTELEKSVKMFEKVLEGIAGTLKPNSTM